MRKIDSSKLETNFYRKESEQKVYLQCKSEHLESLKRSIRFGQVLCVRCICSTENELNNKLIGRRYLEQEKNNSIERTKTFDKQKLLE